MPAQRPTSVRYATPPRTRARATTYMTVVATITASSTESTRSTWLARVCVSGAGVSCTHTTPNDSAATPTSTPRWMRRPGWVGTCGSSTRPTANSGTAQPRRRPAAMRTSWARPMGIVVDMLRAVPPSTVRVRVTSVSTPTATDMNTQGRRDPGSRRARRSRASAATSPVATRRASASRVMVDGSAPWRPCLSVWLAATRGAASAGDGALVVRRELRCEAGAHPRAKRRTVPRVLLREHLALVVDARDQSTLGVRHQDVDLHLGVRQVALEGNQQVGDPLPRHG